MQAMYEIIEIIESIWMLLIPIAIVSFILLIAALVSILRKDIPKDRTTDKILWIVVVILLDIIGPVIYFAIGSRKLDELSQRDEDVDNYDNMR